MMIKRRSFTSRLASFLFQVRLLLLCNSSVRGEFVLRLPGYGCNDFQDKNLGTSFATPQECGEAALQDEECTGTEIMWSPYSYSWGCRCCGPKPVGETDEEAYTSNPNWNIFKGCAVGQQLVSVTVLTDRYPGETTWSLSNSCDNEVVLTDGPYNQLSTPHVVTACLPADKEYTFTISDTWGDGICCGYGQGYYSVSVEGNEIFSGGDFGAQDANSFGSCQSSATPPPSRGPSSPPTPYPSPSPTRSPTRAPTMSPSLSPTTSPSATPTKAPTTSPSATPTRSPTTSPSATPTRSPTTSPSATPTKSPTSSPTHSPTFSQTPSPTSPPTKSPSLSPSNSPSSSTTTADSFCVCSLLTQAECTSLGCNCAWGGGACDFVNEQDVDKWHGFFELAQTHVVHATLEQRHAPKLIQEREAELLFTPTLTEQATPPPTFAPASIDWGLEQQGAYEVVLPTSLTWPESYPNNKADVIEQGSEYYLPNERPDVDIEFDLGAERFVDTIFLKLWYVTSTDSISVGVCSDDGAALSDPPSLPVSGWTWYDMVTTGSYNREGTINPKVSARYIKIRLRGGTSSYSSSWGLREVRIKGALDGLVNNGENSETSGGSAFIPQSNADVRIAAYTPSGELAGVLQARSPEQIRGIVEESLVEDGIDPYTSEAWSVTIPWNWVKAGTKLIIGTHNQGSGSPLQHTLFLSQVTSFSEHTLVRTKVVIFGTAEEASALDTSTVESKPLATGMYSAMPVAELKWVDSKVWHLPYLVQGTSDGPRLVQNELERRSVMVAAGDDAGTEPGWDILKGQLALMHNLANTGRGFSTTETGEGDWSPYASGTSIFMGYAKSVDMGSSNWEYKPMGYWNGWSAAASTGWCGMKPGDECGNTLIHEIGHSQTMGHFTQGSAASWGIQDEYPLDGTNMATHPWGYDTVSRRFRTWFDVSDGTGKRDPMNGGEPPNIEGCFPQYTAYHAAKSSHWGANSPLLLSARSSSVATDGAYLYSSESHEYEKLNDLETFRNAVESSASLPEEVGVPVLTFIGTLGDRSEACQTYPPIVSSHGNTFAMPDPFTAGHPSVYNDSRYFVKVRFENGSSEQGIIAAPDLSGSNELRHFGFTIASSRRPIAVDLYRFNTASYPSATTQSTKTLLHTRDIDLQWLEGTPSPFRVGRGWLGDSNELTVKRFCISETDCASKQSELKWRESAAGVSFTSSLTPSDSTTSANIFEVPVSRKSDGSAYTLKVAVARFFEDGGENFPVLSSPPTWVQSVPADSSHGISIWVPYELNSHLPVGSYLSSSSALAVTSSGAQGNTVIKISAQLELLEPTATVDLSNGGQFIGEEFPIPASSGYFIAKDSAVGPTTRVWWGGSRSTIFVPLVSSCVPDNGTIVASIKAQQRQCGGGTPWQMNAGRSASDCGHQLVLSLDGVSSNPWINNESLVGCQLQTHPSAPIIIEARSWHTPSDGLVSTPVLRFVVNL